MEDKNLKVKIFVVFQKSAKSAKKFLPLGYTVDDLLASLGGGKTFTKLDLALGLCD